VCLFHCCHRNCCGKCIAMGNRSSKKSRRNPPVVVNDGPPHLPSPSVAPSSPPETASHVVTNREIQEAISRGNVLSTLCAKQVIWYPPAFITVHGSNEQYCFRQSFFSATMLTHEPLHLAWWNFARTCSLTTTRTPENFNVIRQRSRSH